MSIAVFISLFGSLNSLVIGLLVFRSGSRNQRAGRYLALLMLLVAVRLGKLAVQDFGSAAVVAVYFNLMHASYLALGPTLLAYVTAYVADPERKGRVHWAQYGPAIVFFAAAGAIRALVSVEAWSAVYMVTLFHLGVYAAGCVRLVFRSTWLYSDQRRWLLFASGVGCVLAASNLAHFLLGFPFYLVTGGMTVVLMYALAHIGLSKQHVLFGGTRTKYHTAPLTDSMAERLGSELDALFLNEKIHLDPKLGLASVAARLEVSPQVLSQLVNLRDGGGFAETVNRHRVATAKELLNSEEHAHLKIMGIALESGFGSVSTFNSVFKSMTGQTPSQFRSSG